MPAVGGSLEAISLDGREFAIPADSEAQRKLGGWENEVQANGNNTARLIKTRVPLSLDGVTIEIDDTAGDHEFIQALVDLKRFFPIALTYASGAVWQGSAQVVGEFQASSQSTTGAISLQGPGVLTKQ